jgi:hypothetical protein
MLGRICSGARIILSIHAREIWRRTISAFACSDKVKFMLVAIKVTLSTAMGKVKETGQPPHQCQQS